MDEIPTELTGYCIVHLWDWSIKSHISMDPFDFPMKSTPALVGLQHPAVWNDPFVIKLVNNGTSTFVFQTQKWKS